MTSRRFSIRFDSDVADRVDVLARYVGRDRSGFIRLAVALADCSLTLRDLRETEGATADDPRVIRVTQDMAVS